MDDALLNVVLERLEADAALADDVALLVLAACEGDKELDDALGGHPKERPQPTPADEQVEPAGAYLSQITVEGFRGVGPRRVLELTPGPGLTLVVGRNRSGKSSFVEGLEVLLTGESQRWTGRKEKTWRGGWRNLHVPDPTSVEAALVVDGVPGTTTVTRAWIANDDDVTAGVVGVRGPDGAKTSLDALGWTDALEMYRPFLSYNELGSILDEGPSRLYDALFAILGLEHLADAQERLAAARKEREDAAKRAKADLTMLRRDVADVDDERAVRVKTAIAGNEWDLVAVRGVLTGADADDAGGELDVLRRLVALEGPPATRIDEVATEAREAADELEAVAATDAASARTLAELLALALTHHDHSGDGPCPVCGQGTLDQEWRTRATKELEQQRARAQDATAAMQRVDRAWQALRTLVGAPPALLTQAELVGVDGAPARAWETMRALPIDLHAAASHVETTITLLDETLAKVRDAAAVALQTREDMWLPLAASLTAWLPIAERAVHERQSLDHLKAAHTWLREAGDDIRNERLAPIAEQAAQIWSLLRQQSNVDLGPMRLEGTKTSRRVNLDVTVDGVESVALSVMSQGELHALALAIFLPRATVADSPFRFLVIDDPVQAMDPAKVDGLATVLNEVAARRQVVVFTHDDRLPEAVRRLGIAATVVQVTRGPLSVVELAVIGDPATRHIADAMAIAKTDDLPEVVRQRVVPGFCRLAIEAVLTDIARRRLLRRGVSHHDVESRIASCTTLNMRAALALFEDESKGGEAAGRLGMYGRSAPDSFRAVNRGSHVGLGGDLVGFVRDAERLVNDLRRQL